jgi:hypothetical protein
VTPADSGFTDMTCKRCNHAPESHHAGKGQCYSCNPTNRCVCWEPRNQLAFVSNSNIAEKSNPT